MYRLHFTIFALLSTFLFATAQTETTISLPFSISTEFDSGKWEKWPENWNSEKEEYGFPPVLSIKQIDISTFELQLEGGLASGMFPERVKFDAAETRRVRKKTNNDNISVYKYEESRNSLWMENVTLQEIVSDKSNWISNSNAKMYIWYSDLGSAFLYKSNRPSKIDNSSLTRR